MNAEEQRSIQAPLKESYREAPEKALITLRAQGRLSEGVSCKIETGRALVGPTMNPGGQRFEFRAGTRTAEPGGRWANGDKHNGDTTTPSDPDSSCDPG